MCDCTVVQSLPAASWAGLWLETKTRQQQQNNNNLAKLEASLAPAEAEFGAVAKADQHSSHSGLQ